MIEIWTKATERQSSNSNRRRRKAAQSLQWKENKNKRGGYTTSWNEAKQKKRTPSAFWVQRFNLMLLERSRCTIYLLANALSEPFVLRAYSQLSSQNRETWMISSICWYSRVLSSHCFITFSVSFLCVIYFCVCRSFSSHKVFLGWRTIKIEMKIYRKSDGIFMIVDLIWWYSLVVCCALNRSLSYFFLSYFKQTQKPMPTLLCPFS